MADKFLVSLMLQAKGSVLVICQVTSKAGFDARAGYTYATLDTVDEGRGLATHPCVR